MTVKHCLNVAELRELIKSKAQRSEMGSDVLRGLVEDAEAWQAEIGIHTYFLSRILEAEGEEEECYRIIGMVYGLRDGMWLSIQELDVTFVAYMLSHIRRLDGVSLEEELAALHVALMERQYGKAIRY